MTKPKKTIKLAPICLSNSLYSMKREPKNVPDTPNTINIIEKPIKKKIECKSANFCIPFLFAKSSTDIPLYKIKMPDILAKYKVIPIRFRLI